MGNITESFQLFGPTHIGTIVALVIIGFLLIFITAKYANDKQKIIEVLI